MKTIKVTKKSISETYKDYMYDKVELDSYNHLRNYFGYPVHEEEDGILYLYNNSNYYTPIKLKKCTKEDADYNFVNYKAKLHRYYKYA